ncbi:hypothetical protein [Rhodanobacter sp. B05]|uniref:hypothetical protein n=1 Tax=Rhodanobacter sp. B05 TaxID=1945859 RepID=UPI0011155501|nr:hypothetical protein [Rhodanobacter sp. B05]
MKLLYVAMFALTPLAQAGSLAYVAKVDLEPVALAYASAAKLPMLNSKSGFALRVWSRDYMLGNVHGTVVASGQLRTLDTTSKYAHGNVIIEPAALSASRSAPNQRKLEALVIALAPYNGTSISCGVMDGSSVLVHAAFNGRTVTVKAGNPSHCPDKASKIVVQLLQELRGEPPREVSPNSSVKRTPKPLRGSVTAYFKR